MEKKIKIIIAIILVIVIGVIGFKLIRAERPTAEEASAILAENIQNTLELNSFTAISDGVFEVKDGEDIILRATLEEMQSSIINPFDFANQDSSMTFHFNVLMNFEAIASFVKRVEAPEEIDLENLDKIRALGEANISAIIKMKSIDFDSYMKIVKVEGLKEIVAQLSAIDKDCAVKEMMEEIEPYLGIWRKTPADPMIKMMMTPFLIKIEGLVSDILDTYYVREVLPNTEVNETPVYNFVLGVDLDGVRSAVISFVSPIADMLGMKEMVMTTINETWPKVIKIIEAMETDSRVYICQETRFTMKEVFSMDVNLSKLVIILEGIMQAVETEVTPEEEAEFARMKQAVKNMRVIMTMNILYSNHNAVPEILPPAEYEVVEVPGHDFFPMPEFNEEPINGDFPMMEFPMM